MRQALHMITVAGAYTPLAGSGMNTIRMFSPKYQGLRIGDPVVMTHTDVDPASEASKDVDHTLATEVLSISAYALGEFANIIHAHGERNHNYRGDFLQFEDTIEGFYPNTEDPYAPRAAIAIYF